MIRNKTEFRPSEPSDRLGIASVIKRAFDRDAEVELVDALLDGPYQTISHIAVLDGQIIGHVLFSQIEGPERSLALGPLSVDPDWRDFLIGTELVSRALPGLRAEGWNSVFVLGDPIYYGRFGFKRALAERVTSQYQSPYLHALELKAGCLKNYKGSLTYLPPFSELAP